MSEIVRRTGGSFYAQGDRVLISPLTAEYADGNKSQTMGYVVCTCVDASVAAEIARVLERGRAPSIEDYSEMMIKTAIYKHPGKIGGLSYVAMKMAGEAGEFAEKVGKIIRDTDLDFSSPYFDIPSDRRQSLVKEIGDMFWYGNAACRELGVSLRCALDQNVEKLRSRAERGTLKGSGDDR